MTPDRVQGRQHMRMIAKRRRRGCFILRRFILRRLLLAAAAAVPTAAAAQDARTMEIATLRAGTLSFLGHATVGDFVGSTHAVSGAVVGDLANPRGWVEARTATLVTHNDRRDRDMRASLEVDRFPTMRLDVSGAGPVSARGMRGDTAVVSLNGRLAIHGVTRAVQLPVVVTRTADTIHVTGSFPLDLADYDIGGLTRFLGLLRMQPLIEVRVDLLFVSLRGAP